MGTNRMILRYACCKPFMVKAPDIVTGRMGSYQILSGTWSGSQINSTPIKALVLRCIDGV